MGFFSDVFGCGQMNGLSKHLGVVSCDTYQNFFQESAFWRF